MTTCVDIIECNDLIIHIKNKDMKITEFISKMINQISMMKTINRDLTNRVMILESLMNKKNTEKEEIKNDDDGIIDF